MTLTKYKVDDKQLKFLQKLRNKVNLELQTSPIASQYTTSGIELVELLDEVITSGEYDREQKLTLNALRYTYQNRI